MMEYLKFGLYILLLFPGYLFVQTVEYHLLREKKPQFEKIFDVVIFSAVAWLIFLLLCPVMASPEFNRELSSFLDAVIAGEPLSNPGICSSYIHLFALPFLLVNFFSIVAAHIWGFMRRIKFLNSITVKITGRDWYPSCSLKFLADSVGGAIIVKVENQRYMGILDSVPDRADDPYIILRKVFLLPSVKTRRGGNNEIEPLPLVRRLLIKFDDLKQIQALTEEKLTIEQKETMIGEGMWSRLLRLARRVFHGRRTS